MMAVLERSLMDLEGLHLISASLKESQETGSQTVPPASAIEQARPVGSAEHIHVREIHADSLQARKCDVETRLVIDDCGDTVHGIAVEAVLVTAWLSHSSPPCPHDTFRGASLVLLLILEDLDRALIDTRGRRNCMQRTRPGNDHSGPGGPQMP